MCNSTQHTIDDNRRRTVKIGINIDEKQSHTTWVLKLSSNLYLEIFVGWSVETITYLMYGMSVACSFRNGNKNTEPKTIIFCC